MANFLDVASELYWKGGAGAKREQFKWCLM